MRRCVFGKKLFGLLLVTLLMCGGGKVFGVAVGEKPKFSYRSMSGKMISNETLRGKLVVLDFWATWCGPCVKEMPKMKELHKWTRGKGVELIGISLDSSSSSLKQYLSKEEIGWEQVFGGNGWDSKPAKAFGIRSIPRVYILAPDGSVAWSGHPANMQPKLDRLYKQYAAELRAFMNADTAGILPEVSDDVRAETLRLVDEATDAMRKKDYIACIDALAAIPEEATNDPRIISETLVMATKMIPRMARSKNARQKLKNKKKQIDQIKLLRKMVRENEEKIKEAKEKRKIEKANAKQAAIKLSQAKAALAKGDRYKAYELCEWVLQRSPESEQGLEAAKMAEPMKAEPGFVEKFESHQHETVGKKLLQTAASYENSGLEREAVRLYKKVLAECGKSKTSCKEAKMRLELLGYKVD